MAVVCAGAKSILDIPRTFEVLVRIVKLVICDLMAIRRRKVSVCLPMAQRPISQRSTLQNQD